MNVTDNYLRIIDTLKTCKRVLVTTHVRPDGDALGSCAAIVLGMKKKGIESEVLLLSHLPTKYSFVFKDHAIPYFDVEKSWPESFDLNQYDALLVVDTGWFQFSNTRPFTMRLAATLMEAGVDTDRLYQQLYQNERAQRVLLQTRAMQSMELLAGGKLAVMTIRKQDFADTGAHVPDTE